MDRALSHGMVIQYHENGSKRIESQYVYGKRIGMEINKTMKSGSKFNETPYLDGNANLPKGFQYRQDGSVESETIFAKHKFQSKIWYREDGSKWKKIPFHS